MVVRRVEIILGPFEKKACPQKVVKSTFWDPTEIMLFLGIFNTFFNFYCRIFRRMRHMSMIWILL